MTDARSIKDADALARKSFCVMHPDAPLRIEIAQGKPNLWCRKCQGRPASVQQRQSLTSQYKQGMPIAAAIEPHMRRKYGEWNMLDEQTRAVVLREPDETAIATVVAQFKVAQPDVVKLPLPEQIKVAQLVAAYDLQPFHVHIQGYKNNKTGGMDYSMALTYEGRLFCAKHPNSMGQTFAGVTARAMTQQERQDNDIPEGQRASVASVFQIVAGQRVEISSGIGRAGKSRDDGRGGSPIAMANPQEMADTRSKRRALAEAAPLGVSISTLTPAGGWDEDVIEGEARVLGASAEDLGLPDPSSFGNVEQAATALAAIYQDGEPPVDTETGEIGGTAIQFTTPMSEPKPRLDRDDEYTKQTVVALVEAGHITNDPDSQEPESWIPWFKFGVDEGFIAVGSMLRLGFTTEQVVAAANAMAPRAF